MIKLIPNPTFKQTIKLTVPGEALPVEVEFTYNYMTAAQCAEWFKTWSDKAADAAIAEVVCGWAGVVDEAEKDVPYSKEALRQLLVAYQPAALEIIRAWQQGLTESRIKN